MYSDVFYKRTSDSYGNQGEDSIDATTELAKVNNNRGADLEKQKFVNAFYRRSNDQVGKYGYQKNALTRAVDDMNKVTATKHFVPPAEKTVPKGHADSTIMLNFDNYVVPTKQENEIYSTSANEIGKKAPKFPVKLHPHTSKFTSQFTGFSRDAGLNTSSQPDAPEPQ